MTVLTQYVVGSFYEDGTDKLVLNGQLFDWESKLLYTVKFEGQRSRDTNLENYEIETGSDLEKKEGDARSELGDAISKVYTKVSNKSCNSFDSSTKKCQCFANFSVANYIIVSDSTGYFFSITNFGQCTLPGLDDCMYASHTGADCALYMPIAKKLGRNGKCVPVRSCARGCASCKPSPNDINNCQVCAPNFLPIDKNGNGVYKCTERNMRNHNQDLSNMISNCAQHLLPNPEQSTTETLCHMCNKGFVVTFNGRHCTSLSTSKQEKFEGCRKYKEAGQFQCEECLVTHYQESPNNDNCIKKEFEGCDKIVLKDQLNTTDEETWDNEEAFWAQSQISKEESNRHNLSAQIEAGTNMIADEVCEQPSVQNVFKTETATTDEIKEKMESLFEGNTQDRKELLDSSKKEVLLFKDKKNGDLMEISSWKQTQTPDVEPKIQFSGKLVIGSSTGEEEQAIINFTNASIDSNNNVMQPDFAQDQKYIEYKNKSSDFVLLDQFKHVFHMDEAQMTAFIKILDDMLEVFQRNEGGLQDKPLKNEIQKSISDFSVLAFINDTVSGETMNATVNKYTESPKIELSQRHKEEFFGALFNLSYNQIVELKSKFQTNVDTTKIISSIDFSNFLIVQKQTHLMEYFNHMFSLSANQRVMFNKYLKHCKTEIMNCSFQAEDLIIMRIDETKGRLLLQAAMKYTSNQLDSLYKASFSDQKIDSNVFLDFRDTLSCDICSMFKWPETTRAVIIYFLTAIKSADKYLSELYVQAVQVLLEYKQIEAESLLRLVESMSPTKQNLLQEWMTRFDVTIDLTLCDWMNWMYSHNLESYDYLFMEVFFVKDNEKEHFKDLIDETIQDGYAEIAITDNRKIQLGLNETNLRCISKKIRMLPLVMKTALKKLFEGTADIKMKSISFIDESLLRDRMFDSNKFALQGRKTADYSVSKNPVFKLSEIQRQAFLGIIDIQLGIKHPIIPVQTQSKISCNDNVMTELGFATLLDCNYVMTGIQNLPKRSQVSLKNLQLMEKKLYKNNEDRPLGVYAKDIQDFLIRHTENTPAAERIISILFRLSDEKKNALNNLVVLAKTIVNANPVELVQMDRIEQGDWDNDGLFTVDEMTSLMVCLTKTLTSPLSEIETALNNSEVTPYNQMLCWDETIPWQRNVWGYYNGNNCEFTPNASKILGLIGQLDVPQTPDVIANGVTDDDLTILGMTKDEVNHQLIFARDIKNYYTDASLFSKFKADIEGEFPTFSSILQRLDYGNLVKEYIEIIYLPDVEKVSKVSYDLKGQFGMNERVRGLFKSGMTNYFAGKSYTIPEEIFFKHFEKCETYIQNSFYENLDNKITVDEANFYYHCHEMRQPIEPKDRIVPDNDEIMRDREQNYLSVGYLETISERFIMNFHNRRMEMDISCHSFDNADDETFQTKFAMKRIGDMVIGSIPSKENTTIELIDSAKILGWQNLFKTVAEIHFEYDHENLKEKISLSMDQNSKVTLKLENSWQTDDLSFSVTSSSFDVDLTNGKILSQSGSIQEGGFLCKINRITGIKIITYNGKKDDFTYSEMKAICAAENLEAKASDYEEIEKFSLIEVASFLDDYLSIDCGMPNDQIFTNCKRLHYRLTSDNQFIGLIEMKSSEQSDDPKHYNNSLLFGQVDSAKGYIVGVFIRGLEDIQRDGSSTTQEPGGLFMAGYSKDTSFTESTENYIVFHMSRNIGGTIDANAGFEMLSVNDNYFDLRTKEKLLGLPFTGWIEQRFFKGLYYSPKRSSFIQGSGNIISEKIGFYGGFCTCPDGSIYDVSTQSRTEFPNSCKNGYVGYLIQQNQNIENNRMVECQTFDNTSIEHPDDGSIEVLINRKSMDLSQISKTQYIIGATIAESVMDDGGFNNVAYLIHQPNSAASNYNSSMRIPKDRQNPKRNFMGSTDSAGYPDYPAKPTCEILSNCFREHDSNNNYKWDYQCQASASNKYKILNNSLQHKGAHGGCCNPRFPVKNWYYKPEDYKQNTERLNPDFAKKVSRAYGGYCTCPNGERYLVGSYISDEIDDCSTELACMGGVTDTCSKIEDIKVDNKTKKGYAVKCGVKQNTVCDMFGETLTEDENSTWNYITEKENNDDWLLKTYNDYTWTKNAYGAFGSYDYRTGVSSEYIRTEWVTEKIYLRKEFTVPDAQLKAFSIRVMYHGNMKVYLNGNILQSLEGKSGRPISYYVKNDGDVTYLKGNSEKNILAVACENNSGEPGICDVRIVGFEKSYDEMKNQRADVGILTAEVDYLVQVQKDAQNQNKAFKALNMARRAYFLSRSNRLSNHYLTKSKNAIKEAENLRPPPRKIVVELGYNPGFNSKEKVTMTQIYIKPGNFKFGGGGYLQDSNTNADQNPNRGISQPEFDAEISKGFYMGETLITKGQWGVFVEETGYISDSEIRGKSEDLVNDEWLTKTNCGTYKTCGKIDQSKQGNSQQPATSQSYRDIKAFIDWLAKKTGYSFNIPSSAQWEYSAKGGIDNKKWWTGDEDGYEAAVNSAWTLETTASSGEYTLPDVGASEKKNDFGLYDMLGLAEEWVSDCYDSKFYEKRHNLDQIVADPQVSECGQISYEDQPNAWKRTTESDIWENGNGNVYNKFFKNYGRYVLRGGSWLKSINEACQTCIKHEKPFEAGLGFGGRVAMTSNFKNTNIGVENNVEYRIPAIHDHEKLPETFSENISEQKKANVFIRNDTLIEGGGECQCPNGEKMYAGIQKGQTCGAVYLVINNFFIF